MLRNALLASLVTGSLLVVSCGGNDSTLFDPSQPGADAGVQADGGQGGWSNEGGATSQGGATNGGGATNEGGAPASGGTPAEGGAPGSGGTPANGGASGSGGASGAGGSTPSCPPELMWCVDRCVDIASDIDNCGYCGIACMIGAECIDAKCQCKGDLTMCGQKCVNTGIDNKNCGGCNHPCGAGMSCESGECVCNNGLEQCGSKCVNLETDQNNCGACGIHCPQPCQNGDCPVATFQECLPKPSGFSSCNDYCESIGKGCLDKCPGDDGGAYARYFDEACTQINMTTGTCSDPIEGSSSIQGFRCCCE